ncbi:hypothetical protein Taro_009189, partial [Colocasia esculenta]|nr:hypothetical protein [Colocasia esculenta]
FQHHQESVKNECQDPRPDASLQLQQRMERLIRAHGGAGGLAPDHFSLFLFSLGFRRLCGGGVGGSALGCCAARRFACAEEARELLRGGSPARRRRGSCYAEDHLRGGHWGFACGGRREGLRRTVKLRGASSGTSAFRSVAPLVPFLSFGAVCGPACPLVIHPTHRTRQYVKPTLFPDYEVEEDHGHCNDEFFQLNDIDDFSHGHGGILELQDDIRLYNDTEMEEVEVNDITSEPEVYQQEEEEDEEEEEEEFLSKSTTDEDDDENELDFCTSKNEDEMATSEIPIRVSTFAFAFASICAFRCIIKALAGAQPLSSPLAQLSSLPPVAPLGSHPPVVDHLDSGPSETNGRRLIALIYSDGRPMKFEPQDVTRSITKALLQYLPEPIAQWKEYPKETSHHFATEREVADARTTWNKIAANRFTDYLNKHKAAAKKVSGNFDDPLMWKGRGPPAIRRDYWDAMCDKWATEGFRHRSRIAAENRTKMPEATLHTSGSISFGRQKRKMETYAEQMVDRHGGDSTQHPEFDAMAWLAATGQPKKNLVFGFGSGLDAGRVISSSQDSYGSTIATTPPHSSTLSSDQVREVIFDTLNTWLTQTLVPSLQTMGVSLRSPASVVSFGASHALLIE